MNSIVTNEKLNTPSREMPSRRTRETEFDATVMAHWQPIYRALMLLVGDHEEAQDLALETFWQLYHRPPADKHQIGGWLYRVATNLGLNALRARKRRLTHERAAGEGAIENNMSDPNQVAAVDEERARVRLVLSEMDQRQARLLLARHSGMSYKELADTLGVSVNSIGTMLVRAEREFEKRYREKGD